MVITNLLFISELTRQASMPEEMSSLKIKQSKPTSQQQNRCQKKEGEERMEKEEKPK